jgi:hypothetical protein
MKTICSAILACLVGLWAISHFAKGDIQLHNKKIRTSCGLRTGCVYFDVTIHKQLPLSVPQINFVYSKNETRDFSFSDGVASKPRTPTFLETTKGYLDWFYNSNPYSAKVSLAVPFWMISSTALCLSIVWIASPKLEPIANTGRQATLHDKIRHHNRLIISDLNQYTS